MRLDAQMHVDVVFEMSAQVVLFPANITLENRFWWSFRSRACVNRKRLKEYCSGSFRSRACIRLKSEKQRNSFSFLFLNLRYRQFLTDCMLVRIENRRLPPPFRS